ncbi:hypothetical protein [Nitrosococcus wardiae]|nr:hypothetical protein [Nitrosococcus wardiae]
MAHLVPTSYSSNRILRQSVEHLYLTAAATYQKRSAKELYQWQEELKRH